jgi:hypothetical protein
MYARYTRDLNSVHHFLFVTRHNQPQSTSINLNQPQSWVDSCSHRQLTTDKGKKQATHSEFNHLCRYSSASFRMEGSSTTANDQNGEETKIGDYTEAFLLERARKIVAERTADWEIAGPNAEDRIPKFDHDEIEVGDEIGRGGFFSVCEVRSIHLSEVKEQVTLETPRCNGMATEDYIQSVVQDREFMERHCLRGKDRRYVVKSMLDVCRSNSSMFINTVVDCAIEAKFLSAVRHPVGSWYFL